MMSLSHRLSSHGALSSRHPVGSLLLSPPHWIDLERERKKTRETTSPPGLYRWGRLSIVSSSIPYSSLPSTSVERMSVGSSRNRQWKKRASMRSSVLGRFGHQESDAYSSENSIIVPLNYAQILGLRGREIWLDPLITAAHDELFAMDLDPSYSSVARLGKEKILYAAREGLRAVRGRVSLIHPDTRLEPALLPGVLALLEQAGEYELVIQLADHGDRINPKDLHPAPSRSTLRDFQRDVALSKALAHCGLAKKALEGEQVALGCARLDEALHILQDSCFPGEEPLAVDLQANINTALNDLKSDAVLDYLRQPLDLAEVSLRNQALQALKSMLQSSSTDGVGADYVSQALAALKAEEICRVFDWDRLARDTAARNKLPWWLPGILPKVGLAHLIAGFVARKPCLVATAGHLLAAGRSEGEVSVPLAVCEVLLGKPNDALDILKEDEHLGASLRGKAGLSKEVKVGGNAFAKAMHAIPPFPDRDGIMDFIRLASAEAEDEGGDLLPGLCLFVEQWMSRIAFPQVRDTREMPPSSSLSEYFDDPATAAYFEAQENPSALSLLGSQIERIFLRGRRILSSAMGQNGAAQTLSKVGLVVAFGLLASGVVVGFGKKQVSTSLVDAGTASSPPLRSSSAKTKTRKTTAEKGKTSAMLTKEAARQLIKDWLDIKAEAMGPRHRTDRLASVLAEPALSAVTDEAKEAASSGWFWQIRPLKVRLDSVDLSALTPEGGYAITVATIDESADLWASNGKKGDSYKTEYKVEYTIVRSKAGWRIATALVVGR